MTKQRIIETEGVTGEFTVESYDKLMRKLMDKGYLDTSEIIKTDIISGTVLEIGPGPGYLGIDWLTKTQNTFLAALDISQDMIKVAQRNASEFKVQDRAKYILGDAKSMPFDNETFDAVFTNGSMHEWVYPTLVLNEVYRVLKKGGLYNITDLRRDISVIARIVLYTVIPKERKKGFLSSLNASYTQDEVSNILTKTSLIHANVHKGLWTIEITGKKY
jgi:ubiquinone/menaquinone biosynthesis C-methylase UbiE